GLPGFRCGIRVRHIPRFFLQSLFESFRSSSTVSHCYFTMRSSTVILSIISVTLAAPTTLVPKASVVGLAVFCTDINYGGSCVEIVEPPFTGEGGCASTSPIFTKSISSAHGVTDGYTCFLYPEINCQGKRLVISGQMPDFRVPSINFNDKALSWRCGSAL
ncbi:hypothetical protein B0H13DRAFT_2430623, partial [Mycena leptocephala]